MAQIGAEQYEHSGGVHGLTQGRLLENGTQERKVTV